MNTYLCGLLCFAEPCDITIALRTWNTWIYFTPYTYTARTQNANSFDKLNIIYLDMHTPSVQLDK